MVIPMCSRGRFISPPKRLQAMRKSKANNLPMIGLCMLILAIATGCAPSLRDIVRSMQPTVRAHPQLQQKLASIKTVAIMPPGATVYQIAGGVMDEETAAARATLATAIGQQLGRDAGVIFTPFPAPSVGLDASRDRAAARLATELEDTQALFEAVSASIVSHTYKHREGALSDWRFVEKLKNFDYSLGPDVQQFAKLANADALLFASAYDGRYSAGTKALAGVVVLALFLPTFGRSTELLTGLGGSTMLSAALVDATTGELLWFNVAGLYGGGYSLTDPFSVTDLTAQILRDFPLGTRPTRNEYDRSGWPSTPGPH